MANQYFVFREMPEIGEGFEVTDAAARHHIFTVMRAKAGDTLRLVFDGGRVGLVEVLANGQVRLLEEISGSTELPVEVTVLVGFPKGDKLDFMVEKLTELGVARVWAVPFKWSVAKWDAKKLAKKQEKLEKVALGAAEQSLRQIVPSVKFFDSLKNVDLSDFDEVLVAYEESAKSGEQTAFAQALGRKPKKLLLVFGPEGGIASEEVEWLTERGAHLAGLGPRILRAETAPLAALSGISAWFELFDNTQKM